MHVELHRLVDVAVLLFDGLVVSQHGHGEAIMFGIGAAQRDLDRPHMLGILRAGQVEVDDIALAQPPQRFHILMVARD